MHTRRGKRVLIYLLLAYGLLLPAGRSGGAVLTFDTIMNPGLPAQIAVQTRKALFPDGGQRVALFFGQKSVGTILTGGDGYGFLTIIPEKTGLIDVTAHFQGHQATGVVLVVDPATAPPAVALEIEAGLAKALISKEFKRDSRRTLVFLSKRAPLIYLTRFAGISVSRTLLARYGYPRAVVLRWQGPRTIDWLRTKGIALETVIASAALLADCPPDIKHRISFDDTEDGVTVEDWTEIREQLK